MRTPDSAKLTREQEKQAARSRLIEILRPGDNLFTVIRHRNAIGDYRTLDVYTAVVEPDKPVDMLRITGLVSQATGFRYDRKHESIGIGGPGINASEEIRQAVSEAIFGEPHALEVHEL